VSFCNEGGSGVNGEFEGDLTAIIASTRGGDDVDSLSITMLSFGDEVTIDVDGEFEGSSEVTITSAGGGGDVTFTSIVTTSSCAEVALYVAGIVVAGGDCGVD
jgi:hypothetical protein